MKKLLLLTILIPSICLAASRVSVENTIDGRKFGATFEKDAKRDAWISKQELKAEQCRGWGCSARSIPKAEMKPEQLPLVIKEYEKVDEVTGYTETWVDLKKSYVVTITDITAEVESEAAAIAARKTEIQQLKAARSIIDGWQSVQDIDLVFLKKFFKRILLEMRE